MNKISSKMSITAEHVVLASDTTAIDFRFTSTTNIHFDWAKETLTTKPTPLNYSDDISVYVTLQLKVKQDKRGEMSSFITTSANLTNSSEQIKTVKFKLQGVQLGQDDTENIIWEKSFHLEMLAGGKHSEFYWHSGGYYKNNQPSGMDLCDKFGLILLSDTFDVIVRFVEFNVKKDVFNYELDKGQCNLPVSMYQDDLFKDIKFVIGEESIMAHKSVLALHSKVFRSMLTLDTKERNKGIIEIRDTDVATFKAFIEYLYTNKIDRIQEVADDLLVLADKYDIQSLRITCERYLCETINKSNALCLFIKADLHKCQMLKKKAIYVIKSHLKILKPHLNKLKEYPNLMNDIFMSLVGDDEGDTGESGDASTSKRMKKS